MLSSALVIIFWLENSIVPFCAQGIVEIYNNICLIPMMVVRCYE